MRASIAFGVVMCVIILVQAHVFATFALTNTLPFVLILALLWYVSSKRKMLQRSILRSNDNEKT